MLCNHIFTVKDDAVSTMNLKADDIGTTVARAPQNLRKGRRDQTSCRKATLRSDQPDIIPEPGIQEIKQVELFTKFRPLLPEKYQDVTCPFPGQEIMDRIKATKNATARDRAAKKRKKSSSALRKEAPPEKNKIKKSHEPPRPRFMFEVDLPVVQSLQISIRNDMHRNVVLVDAIKDGSPMMDKLVAGDELLALNNSTFSTIVEFVKLLKEADTPPRVLKANRLGNGE